MQTFNTLCRGRYYIIPENQRGFSWTVREFDDLVNDLTLTGNHSHYMGPLIVSRTDTDDFNDDNFEPTIEYTLEDGQQRVTTLFILANEIRLRLKALAGAETLDSQDLERLIFYKLGTLRRRLQNRNPALDQYLSYVLTGAPAPPADRTPPMRAMDAVKRRAQEFVAELDEAALVVWKARVQNQAKLILVDLASENINRYLAFDAINSRGLPLSEFDKVKNFCILVSSTRLLGIQADDAWYAAISRLDAAGLTSRGDEASFITELYNTFHNESVSQQGVHDAFVKRYRALLSASDPVLEADFRLFIELWEPYARSFGFIASRNRRLYYGTLCTNVAGTWLDRLDNMDLATITRPMLVASHMRMSGADFEAVARACEIYTFRVYGVVRRRKDRNGATHTEIANAVLRSNRTSAWVQQSLCALLERDAPMRLVLNNLANGEPKYAYDSRMPGWSLCYYFLYEYEIANSPTGVAPLPWATSVEQKANTQEHILPQSHRDGGWWQAHWPDEARADKFKHRLGNLVLTSNNAALARKPIDQKLDGPGAHYYNAPNATNSEKRIRLFTTGGDWTESSILQREIELLEFAAGRWAVPCCIDNGTLNLPDEFVDEHDQPVSITINEVNCVPLPTAPAAGPADEATDED
ncbi:DUF262 domain-containing protein [Phenylobacterium sp.]|uniref:DUF262 domain-containing protein n=1 Tax=Phenylobacterium sp. TaxID=1871053 RepID=UPI002FE2442E